MKKKQTFTHHTGPYIPPTLESEAQLWKGSETTNSYDPSTSRKEEAVKAVSRHTMLRKSILMPVVSVVAVATVVTAATGVDPFGLASLFTEPEIEMAEHFYMYPYEQIGIEAQLLGGDGILTFESADPEFVKVSDEGVLHAVNTAKHPPAESDFFNFNEEPPKDEQGEDFDWEAWERERQEARERAEENYRTAWENWEKTRNITTVTARCEKYGVEKTMTVEVMEDLPQAINEGGTYFTVTRLNTPTAMKDPNDSDAPDLSIKYLISDRGTPGKMPHLVYESSDPDFISVDENGMLTAHREGEETVTITVTCTGLAEYIRNLNLVEPPPSSDKPHEEYPDEQYPDEQYPDEQYPDEQHPDEERKSWLDEYKEYYISLEEVFRVEITVSFELREAEPTNTFNLYQDVISCPIGESIYLDKSVFSVFAVMSDGSEDYVRGEFTFAKAEESDPYDLGTDSNGTYFYCGENVPEGEIYRVYVLCEDPPITRESGVFLQITAGTPKFEPGKPSFYPTRPDLVLTLPLSIRLDGPDGVSVVRTAMREDGGVDQTVIDGGNLHFASSRPDLLNVETEDDGTVFLVPAENARPGEIVDIYITCDEPLITAADGVKIRVSVEEMRITGVDDRVDVDFSNTDGVGFTLGVTGPEEASPDLWSADGYDDSIVEVLIEGGTVRFRPKAAGETDVRISYAGVVYADVTVVVNDCAHEYGAWEVTREPSCAQAGERTRTCAICGKVETEELPAVDHTPETLAGYEASCEESGLTEGSRCTVCGLVLTEQETIPPLGHDYIDVTVVREATCEESGEMTYTCARCGVTQSAEIEATGHDYVSEVAHPSCYSQGYTEYTCRTCGKQYRGDYTDALGHDFGPWEIDTEPTCAHEGVQRRICARCREEEIETIPALEHTPGAAVRENLIEATAETDGSYDTAVYCTVCGAELSRSTVTVPATGHHYGEPIFTWNGYTAQAKQICTDPGCGKETALTVNITEDVTSAATCTKTGVKVYTASVTVNETVYSEQRSETLAMLPHAYGDPEIAWDGYSAMVSRVCATCGRNDHPQATVTSETVQSATCTESGSRTYTAAVTVDGKTFYSYKSEDLPATGHSFGDPVFAWDGYTPLVTRTCSSCGRQERPAVKTDVSSTAPTCTANGANVYTGSVTVNGRTYTDKKTETIPATGHSFGDPVFLWSGYSATATHTCPICGTTENLTVTLTDRVTKQATCTASGTRTYTATVRVNGSEYTDRKTRTLAATGHSFADPVFTWNGNTGAATRTCPSCGTTEDLTVRTTNKVTTEPTCSKAGVRTFTATTTVDGKTYTATKTTAITKLAHTPVTDAAVTPTCTESGLTEGSHCSVCGTVITAQETLPATGHSYGDPAFSWNGYTATARRTCARCGNVEKLSPTVTNKITRQATCTASGTQTYTATVTVDGKNYTSTKARTLAATGHNYVNGICTKCGDTLVTFTIQKGNEAETALTPGNSSSPIRIQVWDSANIRATFKDGLETQNISWTSSDPDALSTDKSAIENSIYLYAYEAGDNTLTLSFNADGTTYTVEFYFSAYRLEVNSIEIFTYVGDTYEISVETENLNAPLSYRMLDTSIATVDSSGRITGRKEGYTYVAITCSAIPEFYREIYVSVMAPEWDDAFPTLDKRDSYFATYGEGSNEYIGANADVAYFTVYSVDKTGQPLVTPYVDASGVTVIDYDPDTNTLTLNGANNVGLDIRGMGNGFKIVVNGRNSLNYIDVSSDSYAASLTICGSGYLSVNSNKDYAHGIYIHGEREVYQGVERQACLMIGNTDGSGDLLLHVYGSESAVLVEASSMSKGIWYLRPVTITNGTREGGQSQSQAAAGTAAIYYDYTIMDFSGAKATYVYFES